MTEKYLIDGMTTVLVFSIDGVDLRSAGEWAKIDEKVEAKVKALVEDLKRSHTKFEDPDFGPRLEDEYGALSFYGSAKPDPAGSKYPAPETLRWERPQYDDKIFAKKKSGGRGVSLQSSRIDVDADEGEDDEEGDDNNSNDDEDDDATVDFDEEFDDEEFGFRTREEDSKIWCRHGKLFLDGSSSGDVIQGQLGDCWFLSALAVLGADGTLLEKCFWRQDSFREFGMYVLRFFKDCNVVFVIIDDRLPVKAKDGRLIFASSKDPNELWVPLIEKAYAKLHGCYKSLIGGYTHYGLADMTGFCPRLVVMREGLAGFSEKLDEEEIWRMLQQYQSWNSLLGCSIQPNPKEKNKVEADAGNGLFMSHAYSFLAAHEIESDAEAEKRKIRLVKLRNPWGRGEWDGAFSDRSPEYERYREQIESVFNDSEMTREVERLTGNAADGTFLMSFEDWLRNFTSLFVAIQFPPQWKGRRTKGKWSLDQGGNRDMGTWITNPKFKLHLPPSRRSTTSDAVKDAPEYRQIFVGLYIKDARMTLGFDYYKDPLYATPLTFDIVTEEELKLADPKKRSFIPRSKKSETNEERAKQPPYNFGTTQAEVWLETGVDYYIVPSLYKRQQAGEFFLTVFADVEEQFYLEGSTVLAEAHKPMVVGRKEGSAPVALKMSVSQFYERKEALRERIVSEAARLNVSYAQLQAIFNDCKEQQKLSRSAFKRRVMDLGFLLTDFPDDDLVVLDEDNDGVIVVDDFLKFYKEGLKFAELASVAPPPEPPVDDLLFKAIDLSGELSVNVFGGRQIRDAASWFNVRNNSDGGELRTSLRYDPQAAQKARENAKRAREAAIVALREREHERNRDEEKEKESSLSPRPNLSAVSEGLDNSLLSPQSVSSRHRLLRTFNTTQTINGNNNDTRSVALTAAGRWREALQQAGDNAAVKLHNEASLQRAEKTRTLSLAALRQQRQNKKLLASTEVTKRESEEQGLLRRKKTDTKSKSRSILKDADAMRWLRYQPSRDRESSSSEPVRSALSFERQSHSQSRTLMRAQTERSYAFDEEQPKSFGSGLFSSQGAPDLWDYLVDCVITISLSRPQGERASPTLRKYALFTSLRDKHTLSREMLQELLSSDAHTTTHKTLGKTESVRARISHPPTPRSQRRETGTASVRSAHTTRRGAPHALATVPEQLLLNTQTLTQHTQLTQQRREEFVEVYRRLLCVRTTSYEEIVGERSLTNPLSLRAQSSAYMRSLFAKFDKNGNGFISKDEFRFAMQDLNVEVSNEECDIFFNRFSSRVANNIDYDEFLHFFEQHMGGATNTLSAQEGVGNESQQLPNAHDEQEEQELQLRRSAAGLVRLLLRVRETLRRTLREMALCGATSIEKFFEKCGNSGNGNKSINGANVSVRDEAPSPTDVDVDANIFASIPDTAVLLSLDVAQANANAQLLQSLGLRCSEREMARVSRIFRCDVCALMRFVRLSRVDLVELLDVMDAEICKQLSARAGVSIRSASGSNVNGSELSSAGGASSSINGANQTAEHSPSSSSWTGTAKIWTALSPSVDAPVSFDALVAYLTDVLSDSDTFTRDTDNSANSSANKSNANNIEMQQVVSVRGVALDVLVRIVADVLVHSSWNRSQSLSHSHTLSTERTPNVNNNNNKESGGKIEALAAMLSFSGLDAYLRLNRVQFIERKLKYLMQLESNLAAPTTLMLVHVYLRNGSNNSSLNDSATANGTTNSSDKEREEMLVVARDPLSGEVFSLCVRESAFSLLPRGEALRNLLTRDWTQDTEECTDEDALSLYNPLQTPTEDALLGELLKRLRLARSRRTNASELLLAEDAQFVVQLQSLLDNAAANLPFFFLLNDLHLAFEVDEALLVSDEEVEQMERLLSDENNETALALVNTNNNSAKKKRNKSIRSVVFAALRKEKTLYSFLSRVHSSLKIVLSTYNGSLKESFLWEEMLAHLTNHRNPFVTVQLLPRYIPPEKYLYEPVESSGAFTGEDEEDEEDEEEEEEGDEEEDDAAKGSSKTNKEGKLSLAPHKRAHKSWQRGPVDWDGAPNPYWDAHFQFSFQPPRLTACRVLFTEVVKMLIGDAWKYVMVLVREGSRKAKYTSTEDPTDTQHTRTHKSPKERFVFLTIYDPKTATEYQCGVHPAAKELYALLYAHKLGRAPPPYDQKALMAALGSAAEAQQLFAGPAVTPRLEICVFNERDEKARELLGQCQVSISAVLSGSGIGERQWVTLVRKTERASNDTNTNANDSSGNNSKQVGIGVNVNPQSLTRSDGKQSLFQQTLVSLAQRQSALSGVAKAIDEYAGQIQVELSFRRSLEIEAERQAAVDRIARRIIASRRASIAATPSLSVRAVSVRETPRPSHITQREREVEEKLRSLQEQNERLSANLRTAEEEKERLAQREPIASVVENVTVEDKADEGEMLRTVLEEKERIEREKERVEREKIALEREVEALRSRASENGSDEAKRNLDRERENDMRVRELQDELSRVQEQYEAVLSSHKEKEERERSSAKEKKETEEGERITESINNNALSSSLSATIISPQLTDMPTQTPQQFTAFLHKLFMVFLQRYERKAKILGVNIAPNTPSGTAAASTSLSVSALSALDGLLRLLQSYANAEGLLGFKEVVLSCQELMIEISTEQAVRLLQEIGPNSRKLVQVHQLSDYLVKEMNQMLKQQKRNSALRTSGELMMNSNNLSSSHQPAQRISPTRKRNTVASSQDDLSKTAPPAAQRALRSKSGIDANMDVDGEQQQETKQEAKRRPISASATVNVLMPPAAAADQQNEGKARRLRAESRGNRQRVNKKEEKEKESVPPPPAEDKPKNWDTEPLPKNWERRFHPSSKRYVYINHEAKTTQWHHPFDSSHET